MPDYTVTTNPDEEAALQWVASEAGQDAEIYFDARMHDVLNSYVKQHAVHTSVAPVDEVAVAYVSADAGQQTAVNNILGLATTKPA